MITGRSETSRKYTADNLKDQGFGEKCAQDGSGKVLRTEGPCYVALHLRGMEKDQSTLASVYKPERRKQLQDAGYTLVATFGDQFSDLEGETSAIASWKLPNPIYLIL
jgi:predicted secreted acid phosphatase